MYLLAYEYSFSGKLNRKADKLLREQFFMDVSQNEYHEIKKNVRCMTLGNKKENC